jgi:hypothetical protein
MLMRMRHNVKTSVVVATEGTFIFLRKKFIISCFIVFDETQKPFSKNQSTALRNLRYLTRIE